MSVVAPVSVGGACICIQREQLLGPPRSCAERSLKHARVWAVSRLFWGHTGVLQAQPVELGDSHCKLSL